MIPIQLKFGGQKGKIVILILFAAVVGAGAAAAKSADLIDRIGAVAAYLSPGGICAAGLAFSILCLLLSFGCSVGIMKRKEF